MATSVLPHTTLATNRPVSRWLKFLAAAISTSISLWLVNYICGYIYGRIPESQPGRMWVEYATGRLQAEEMICMPHPYMLYVNRPNKWQHNSQGYRGDELRHPEILCIGGSTTWGLGVRGRNETWPAQLGRIIGRETANAGKWEASSPELLSGYVFRYRYLDCRTVVIHTGLNDCWPLYFDGYNPEYTHWRGLARLKISTPRPGEAWLLAHSSVAKVVYAAWMRGGFDTQNYMSRTELGDADPDEVLARVQRTEPVGFRRNLELLVRTAQADSAQVILVEETAASIGSREADIPAGVGRLSKALHAALEKNRKVMEEVAAKCGVLVIRPEVPDKNFVDAWHVDVRGEAIKAAAIAETIRSRLQ